MAPDEEGEQIDSSSKVQKIEPETLQIKKKLSEMKDLVNEMIEEEEREIEE